MRLGDGEDGWYSLWSWCWGRRGGLGDPHALRSSCDKFSDCVGEG